MEFVANESKKVEIETSTGVYQRHAIQTHFVQIGENYIDLIERYVKPLYEEGDLLSISEKIIALCQKRVVYRKDMKISWLAKFLSRFAIQHNSAFGRRRFLYRRQYIPWLQSRYVLQTKIRFVYFSCIRIAGQ